MVATLRTRLRISEGRGGGLWAMKDREALANPAGVRARNRSGFRASLRMTT